ncbi:MAG: site-specific integrase [Chloroflexota bacterium]
MSTGLVTAEQSGIALSDAARRYVKKSKAANTLRTYKAAWREFEHFCTGRGAEALPAVPATVIDYLTALADARAKVSTIEVKLAALAWAHRTAGRPDPTVFEAVKATLAGIRRELRRAPTKKEPATLAEIQAMITTLPDTLKGRRDKALLLVGFAGAFRRSELVALDVADVRLNGRLQITIRQSKTDQEGTGLVKTIPAIGGQLCPVAALKGWLDAASIASGPVFRRVDRHGNVYPDRLTPQSVALVVKGTAKDAALDWRAFSGHSLRSGFITDAMDAGASDSDIMEQTGHKTERVMRGYRKSSGVGASRAVLAVFGQA